MSSTAAAGNLEVEVGEAVPLIAEEKGALAPDLERRGLTPDFLDIVTNIPNRTRVVKVRSPRGELLGLTTVLLTPHMFMKHCFGEGNHIGTNNSFFFAPTAERAEVLRAIFRKLLEIRPAGLYIGLVEEDLQAEFRSGLEGCQYTAAEKVLEAGSIATGQPDAAERLLDRHAHLSRQINRFRNKGGSLQVHEGRVPPELGEAFVKCCQESYQKNPHPGAPINVDLYGEHVRGFMRDYPSAVYFYSWMENTVTGVQIFIRHRRHLELTEGGFLSDTFHAYENIIVASVKYAAEQRLERVSYGLILNGTKDRLMDADNRRPVVMLTLRAAGLPEKGLAHLSGAAHEQFPQLFWRERSRYANLPV